MIIKSASAVCILAFPLFSLLATVLCVKEKDGQINNFTVIGSIEPKIEKHMKLKHYQISVAIKIKTIRMQGYNEWIGEVKTKTDHQFSLNLLKGNAKRLLLQQHSSNSMSSNEIVEKMRVRVEAKFHDGRKMSRTWFFSQPDFSLHYSLKVGMLEGDDYLLWVKIALPMDTKVIPKQFKITSFEENAYSYLAPILFGTGRFPFNTRKEAENAIDANLLDISFKLDAKLVNRFLARHPAKPMIELHLEYDQFEEHVKKTKESEKQAIEQEKDDNNNCCSICLEEIKDGEIVSRSKICTHEFHKHCIDKWTMNHINCPNCRRNVLGVYKFIIENPVFSNSHSSLYQVKFYTNMKKWEEIQKKSQRRY